MRKSDSQRRQKFTEAKHRVWEEFRPKLAVIQSYEDATILCSQGPPPDAPGREYYSNLSVFLQSHTIPGGSSYGEKALYLQFIQRFVDAGKLQPGEGEIVVNALKQAMAAQGNWE